MFFGAKEFYDIYYITLLLLETSLELEISRKTKFQSPFLFDLLLHYWFCVNFQMSTEWGFDLANNAIVIYCLIYSLNIPLSNQYSSFSPVENSVSAFLNIDISPTFYDAVVSGEVVTRTLFFCVWLYNCHGRRTCTWFWLQTKST